MEILEDVTEEKKIIDDEEQDDGDKEAPEQTEGENEDVDEDDGGGDDEGEEEVSRFINYSIFGTVELPVPGQPLALALDLDISIIKDMMVFTMSPKGKEKAWDDVFGFDNFDVRFAILMRD